jgi:hypothetical protein
MRNIFFPHYLSGEPSNDGIKIDIDDNITKDTLARLARRVVNIECDYWLLCLF